MGMLKSIGISGTPGVGKSSVAKALSQYLGISVVDLSEYVLEKKLVLFYDSERESYVIDEDRVRDELTKLHHHCGPMIIVSHYIEIVPRDILEVVFVLRKNPRELIETLSNRGWSRRKIRENVEAELLSICTINAINELGEDMVIEIDTTSKSLSEIVKEILDILLGEAPAYYGHRVDWLSLLPQDELEEVLKYVESP